MAYTLLTPATQELITIEQAKKQLRILHNNEDDVIEFKLLAAIAKFQEFTGRVISPSTWQLSLDKFPKDGIIEIMRCKVIEVIEIKYKDTKGNEQTVDSNNTILDNASEPARLSTAHSFNWPDTSKEINAVKIKFRAGYENATQLNKLDLAAIMLMTAHWYRNREDVVVGKTANEVPQTSKDIMMLRKIPNGF